MEGSEKDLVTGLNANPQHNGSTIYLGYFTIPPSDGIIYTGKKMTAPRSVFSHQFLPV